MNLTPLPPGMILTVYFPPVLQSKRITIVENGQSPLVTDDETYLRIENKSRRKGDRPHDFLRHGIQNIMYIA